MKPLTAAAAAAVLTAAAVLAAAAWGILARERALDRAAGPTDTCQCRVCTRVRRSALTAISPDGEW